MTTPKKIGSAVNSLATLLTFRLGIFEEDHNPFVPSFLIGVKSAIKSSSYAEIDPLTLEVVGSRDVLNLISRDKDQFGRFENTAFQGSSIHIDITEFYEE